MKPEQVGRYRILKLLGQGVFGQVYLAHDPDLARDVAIKFVSTPNLQHNDEHWQRFRQEVQAAAQLKHPHIITIYDVNLGDQDSQEKSTVGEIAHEKLPHQHPPYVVMEFLDGGTLLNRLSAEPMPFQEIEDLFLPLCQAMSHAHQMGVIHRDVKPANIMFAGDEANTLKLVDFGLARWGGSEYMSQVGNILGTPSYMSPEQAQGHPVDARTDIYALGVILFQMATGQLPFEADSTYALITKQVNEPVPFPSSIVFDIPLQLETIILKAMEKNPDNRYQSADEMGKALIVTGSIKMDMSPIPSTSRLAPTNLANALAPFKGLQYYTEADEHIFFGRDTLVTELLDHLSHHHFLAVVGASGSGKSSLIRAGLIPAVRQGKISLNMAYATWEIHVITPGNEPIKALAVTLTRNSESVTATATLIEDMRKNTQSLDLWLYRESSESNIPRLIVIDQFEELFTQCQDSNERQLFIANLVQAIESGQQGNVTLLISLRADFYAHVLRYEGLRNFLENRQKIIGTMSKAEVRATIEEPARQDQWAFQPGLVETILQDLNISANNGAEVSALPLLSHALLETWQRREGQTMTLAGYQAVGGIRRAIAKTADDVYQKLSENEQTVAKNIFLRLTNLGDATEDTRRRVGQEELISLADNGAEIQSVLAILIEARLVTVDETNVEVAHEALIREWPLLRQWLDEDRENIHLHRQLTEAAQIWRELDYDSSSLLRGLRLLHMETWMVESDRRLSDLELSFLNASREAILFEERAEIADRQRIRKVSLFGMIGGAFSFSLSFLLLYAPQISDSSLLMVLVLLRVLLGAVGGLLFIILVDMAVSWYQGTRKWVSWLLGGLGGAVAFALLLLFDALLKESDPSNEFFVIFAAIEGAVWGFSIGIGRVWLLHTKRPLWQTLPIIGLCTSLVLLLAEQVGSAFVGASLVAVALVGAFVPLSILIAAQLAELRADSSNDKSSVKLEDLLEKGS